MESLSLILYTEIDIMCLLLLTYVAFKSHRHVERRESWHFFQLAVYCILLFTASDLVWKWMECGLLPKTPFTSYVVNCFYFIFCMTGIAAWFFYTEYELDTELIKAKWFICIAFIPLVLTLSVLVLNGYNHCLFYFDEEGVYQRGVFNISALLIPCLYLGFCEIHSLIMAFQKKRYIKRRHYLNLATFALPAVVPAILQVFIVGTPLPGIGLTLSVLMVYMTAQELLVSIDPLTRLNNRNQMIRYLSHKLEHREENTHLFLLILDLDRFKQINDTFGHVEGDAALIQFASVLKQTSSAFNCFISRYGGDEFIIVYETEEEKNLDSLCRYIHEKLEESNKKSGKEYRLTTSIGYAKYTQEIHYVPEFISKADQKLYEVKTKRPY